MTAPDVKALDKRIYQATATMLIKQPFFGCCLMYMLPRVQAFSPEVDTMAVDGVHLYWNADFVAKLTDAELSFVLAHEVMHIALRHQLRLGPRDARLWNIAADYAINAELKAAGMTMPACGLFDPKYNGMSSEEVYELLLKDPTAAGGGAGGSDPGGCGGVKPSPAGGDGTPGASPATLADEWQSRIRGAVRAAEKAGSHTPESIKRMIAELDLPAIDWRETFRRFVGSGLSDDSTWARPNRRLVSSGIYMPTRERDALRRVLVVFDTSGSISDENLRKDASEAKAMLDDAGCEVMQWACVDTDVRSRGEVDSGEDVPFIHFDGGGGTDFESAMEWAAEQPDVSCMVFFTDGVTRSWGKEPPFPVLWCGHGDRLKWEAAARKAPFGEAVYRGE